MQVLRLIGKEHYMQSNHAVKPAGFQGELHKLKELVFTARAASVDTAGINTESPDCCVLGWQVGKQPEDRVW